MFKLLQSSQTLYCLFIFNVEISSQILRMYIVTTELRSITFHETVMPYISSHTYTEHYFNCALIFTGT